MHHLDKLGVNQIKIHHSRFKFAFLSPASRVSSICVIGSGSACAIY